MLTYEQVVQYLESLQIMPKTMPGLDKMRLALADKDWFRNLDPGRIIVVAGTNGKGTTCAALESLLTEAGQKVGFYSSPHLVSTTERIRISKADISESDFIQTFLSCQPTIEKYQLTHFESLTLMAGEYFFGSSRVCDLDFAIFEVGLGGEYDATNAIPHRYCIVTKLGFDHVNILGNTISEIARNKFGIVGRKNIVVHHPLPFEVSAEKEICKKKTNSNWVEAEKGELVVKRGSPPSYYLKYAELTVPVNMPGKRGIENLMSAITMFQILGFDLRAAFQGLNKISWAARMQRVSDSCLPCPLYLSGDHNEQGVASLVDILDDFDRKKLHLIVGIGVDKDAQSMLQQLYDLPETNIYITKTPFKGREVADYPEIYLGRASGVSENFMQLLESVSKNADPRDLCVVTGSLYLVGAVARELRLNAIRK